MATGNVKDPKKLSKSKILSNFDSKLQKETEQAIKRNKDLELNLGIKNIKQLEKESDKSVEKLSRTWQKKLKDYGKDVVDSLALGMINVVTSGWNSIEKGVDDFVGKYASYYANINTRLLGTGRTYNELLNNIKGAVTGSRATSVVNVLENLSKLVNQGIAYNVEQRAFLETISDKIATTFNAANGTLLQLIRLNRADSTAAYLGMEASLTEFLNARFSDTNYLTQNINETVSAAIYEATSQLGRNQGAEFEYVIQKWLGSFYESGVNQNTIQSIAQGLGYLGSGNVSALTSNTQLSNLFISAANNAGLNYSQLLTQGIDANSANKLLQGIYQQTRTMAQSGDQVARSQFASMFGMTLSDMTAIMRLTSDDLVSISSNMYTYSDMIAKTEYELHQVASRTSVAEAIQNTISNVMAEIGYDIAENAGLYLTWELAKMIEGKINIPIPFTSGVDLGTTMKASILGFNMLSAAGEIMTALTAGKELSLNNFAGLEQYGGGFVSSAESTTLTRTSGSATYYATSDSTSMASGSVAEMSSRGADIISSPDVETGATIDTLIEYLEDDLKPFKRILSRIDGMANGSVVLTVQGDTTTD